MEYVFQHRFSKNFALTCRNLYNESAIDPLNSVASKFVLETFGVRINRRKFIGSKC